ncbi:alpha/beta fold hydrolase [Planctomicrobium sp. SH664]|uniref:alpha/beta fold hydrolase n=1 Tax=Planctomicrobium sp. SH664 TaxID=3448125 RepID=UPI003F5C8A05
MLRRTPRFLSAPLLPAPLPRFLQRLLTAVILAIPIAGPAGAGDPLEGNAPPSLITTGDIHRLIGDAVPHPPPPMRFSKDIFKVLRFTPEAIEPDDRIDQLQIEKDITYATYDKVEVSLDLYQPRQRTDKAAGVILIHGGGWVIGSKGNYSFYGIELATRGYVVANIDYRMAPQHPFPAAVQDAKAAVRWMRAHAEELNVDPERISVVGASAGGHLALMVGYSDDVPFLEGTGGNPHVTSHVRSVVAIYPPSDLTTISPPKQESPLLTMFLGRTRQESPETYRVASPVNYVTPQDPPTLLLHGTVDLLVPVSQSDDLARKLEETRVPFVYDRLPGWPHSMDRLKPVNERCLWFIERFLEKTLTPVAVEPL